MRKSYSHEVNQYEIEGILMELWEKGLDLSGNNRKKKDKKGFERVLTMVDKVGLRKMEVYKHELNMITDNRPYQELVLDASPLKMVAIKELEPVSIEEQEITSLWLLWMRLQILKIWVQLYGLLTYSELSGSSYMRRTLYH
ncbi:hypothetical protein FXO38_12001 [Capsicum annuum]|uniref:Uncharacterized protein n=1 Tax=Capsicum annuum TaxID=4072 RepID=A0A2G2ZY65_CAPAN|nr:hypothetical protein FXO38_12001 [Capsicum annuum]PHT86923.1 hypothetical protein T459_09029 [Capsicum annuum]